MGKPRYCLFSAGEERWALWFTYNFINVQLESLIGYTNGDGCLANYPRDAWVVYHRCRQKNFRFLFVRFGAAAVSKYQRNRCSMTVSYFLGSAVYVWNISYSRRLIVRLSVPLIIVCTFSLIPDAARRINRILLSILQKYCNKYSTSSIIQTTFPETNLPNNRT